LVTLLLRVKLLNSQIQAMRHSTEWRAASENCDR